MKYGITTLPDSICVAVHQHLAHILKHGATAHIHRAQLLQQKKIYSQRSGSRKNSQLLFGAFRNRICWIRILSGVELAKNMIAFSYILYGIWQINFKSTASSNNFLS